ncbi:MAG: hypothetical protein HOP17_09255 [Acidobacteria bacterium]|nr:hypothetical protein [Acidobacteriota bacterium]
MFCPKCGTQNPETGKFCRSCGVDLGNVSAVLSGDLPAHLTSPAMAEIQNKARRRNDPNEVYASAIRNMVSGLGFLIVAIALLTTNVAGGHSWWWAMLFPAFSLLAKGISDYMKHGKMEKSQVAGTSQFSPRLDQPRGNMGLPPTRTDYVSTDNSRYKTGDLVPPSVTDGTTKHLEMNSEGETMTLPKK